MSVIVDAAALLAVLLDEPGSEIVLPVLRGASMSAVNTSESCSRGVERGSTIDAVLRAIRRFEIIVYPFDLGFARVCAELRPMTKSAGISLGDRACIALGLRLNLPILTADRRMGALEQDYGVPIRLIR